MYKALMISDVHLSTDFDKSYLLVKKFAKDFKPDETIILGDFLDLSIVSKFATVRDKEGGRLLKEFQTANKELDYWQKVSKKVTYLYGNHEFRIQAHLDKYPELEGIIDIDVMLKFKERNIEWYEYNKEYQVANSDLYCTHGAYHNQYHSRKHLETYGRNIIYGHMHNQQLFSKVMRGEKQFMAQSIGCLCNLNPDYLHNRPSNFINGFGVAYIDDNTGHFTFYNIPIIENAFIFNGKHYKEV